METNNTNSQRQLDIKVMFHTLMKHKLSIILISCIAAIGMFIFSNITYKPVYRTSSTLIITDSRASTNVMTNLNTTNELAVVLSTIFDSNELRETVYTEMGFSSMPGTINTQLIPDTNFFTFSVDSYSPRLSYMLFQTVNDLYPQFTKDVIANAIITVFEPPVVPEQPINSNRSVPLSVIAFIIGIIISSAVILAFSYYSDTIKSGRELRTKLSIKFAAEIPFEKGARTDKRKGISIIDQSRSTAFIESYKNLRTIVETERIKSGVKTIVVTSTEENEGKTSVAANLALTLAQIGRHVLLLDCDFANPSVSSFFGADIPENAQLSGYLSEQSGSNKIIRKFRELPLYIAANRVPAPGSINMIVSKQMSSLISQAKQRYDYVIIDSPALSEKTDAYELSELSDATLLVIRQNYASTNSINNSLRLLNAGNSRLIGFAFNFAENPVINERTRNYGSGAVQSASGTDRRAKYAKS